MMIIVTVIMTRIMIIVLVVMSTTTMMSDDKDVHMVKIALIMTTNGLPAHLRLSLLL